MARFDHVTEDLSAAGDRFCMYASPDGKKCRARRTARSQYCFFHDPGTAAERRAAQKAGGLKNKAAVLPANTPDLPLASLQDVTRLVAETINQTRRGEIDPKVANAVGYLASILSKAIEKSVLEERISALETAVKRPPALASREDNS